jgi:hypothetical protein
LLPTIFQPLAQFKTMGSGALLILFSMYLPSGIFGVVAGGLVHLRWSRRRRPALAGS